MIPFWKKAPFFRLLLPLMAGIITEYYVTLPVNVLCILSLSGSLFWYLDQSLSTFRRFQHAYLSGVHVQLIFFCLGVACTMCHELRFESRHFSKYIKNEKILLLRLDEPPAERAKTYRSVASITHYISEGRKVPVHGKCYVYFKKEPSVQKLSYASVIQITSTPKPILTNDTAAFDFHKYAALQKIYHQVYLKESDYVIHGRDSSFDVYNYLYHTRDYLIGIIHRFLTDPQHAAVAIALLTGYRAELDRSITQMYQSTGTIHVIAISGMHLALIYVLLQYLFMFMEQSRYASIFKELIILILLWLFSLLTGGGASVMRAVIMFSFISFGKMMDKKGSIENALATSAFFMLCYNPYLLWDIGFQLSYAAVLSLVVFMKPIYEMLSVENPLLDGCWKMNAVTLSAQVLTLPLCMYHFHQIPLLFLPANLIAVPLSTIALYGLLLLMVLSPFTLVSQYTGSIISCIIRLMNEGMTYLSQYRFAVVGELNPGLIEIILMYGIIWFSYLFYQTAHKKYFFGGLLCVLSIGIIKSIIKIFL
jgi:competence protein ComEC